MSDENKALIPAEAIGGELIAADQDLLKESTSGGAFLPYLQLFTTKSDAVTEGKINGGEYGLVRDGEITSLGKEVDVIVLTLRGRAFEKDEQGEITVSYDKNDPEYQRIQALQADKVTGRMCGPEFLIFIPSEETFATFFCGSPTLKREARKFSRYLGGKACKMRNKLIDNGKHKWHGPVIGDCSTPPTCVPDADECNELVQRFKNPPKQETAERAADDAQDDVER